MKGNVKIWLRSFRVFTLTGSVIPVILGSILARGTMGFNAAVFVMEVFTIAALQIAANLINDYDDFEKHVDTKESYNSSGVLVDGLLSGKQVKYAGCLLFMLGGLSGIYLIVYGGTVIFYLTITGLIGGYFYTRKPFEFKYRGLGIPLVFLLFGPFPVLGAYYIQTHSFSVQAMVLSILTGLLTTNILHANDIRDIPTDKKAGIKTLAIIAGEKRAKVIYCSFTLFAFLILLISVFTRTVPIISLVVFLSLPVALGNIRQVYSANKQEIINIDQKTAKLQAMFGILLIVSISIRF